MATEIRPHRILLADPHVFFARGLRTVLSTEPDMEVIGEVRTAAEVFEQPPATSPDAAHPDVVIMDMSLMEGGSEEQLNRIRRAQYRLLFLTLVDEARCLEMAIAAGAHGYMLKDTAPSQMIAAIRRVACEDERDPRNLSRIVPDLRALAHSEGQFERSRILTSREEEILRLLAEGRTVRETALELGLSVKTVEAHKLNLMRKLDIHNRATLIQYAVKNKLVEAAPAT